MRQCIGIKRKTVTDKINEIEELKWYRIKEKKTKNICEVEENGIKSST